MPSNEIHFNALFLKPFPHVLEHGDQSPNCHRGHGVSAHGRMSIGLSSLAQSAEGCPLRSLHSTDLLCHPVPHDFEHSLHSSITHSDKIVSLIALKESVFLLEGFSGPDCTGFFTKYVYFILGRGNSPTVRTCIVKGSLSGLKLRILSKEADEPLYLKTLPLWLMSCSNVESV